MKTKRFLIGFSLIILCLCFATVDVLAQCPMCKITAETNLASGGTAGKGLNKGILFLLSLPYLLIGTLGVFWWRNKRKSAETN